MAANIGNMVENPMNDSTTSYNTASVMSNFNYDTNCANYNYNYYDNNNNNNNNNF